jgi:hypothetical protein
MHHAQLRTIAGLAGGVLLLGGVIAAPANAGSPALSPAAAPPPSPYKVVASGLNNPRHLSFSHGSLYVAESGKGGAGPCIISSEGGQVCYGPTGAITKVKRKHGTWKQHRVVKGLPSLAAAVDDPTAHVTKGGSATGPSGVAVNGRTLTVSVGLGAPPSALRRGHATKSPTSSKPATLPKGFGTLLNGVFRSSHRHHGHHAHGNKSHRTWRVLANLARHEARTNPVDGKDTNPASVVSLGSKYLVADAGANTVLKVTKRGKVRTIASFQDTMVQAPGEPTGVLMPMQFVPTAIVPGPHHAYYVSQLTGFPFPKGGAAIWKVKPGHAPKVYASGLTNVTDLAFAPDGSLYAVEISTEGLASGGPPIGALVRIPAGGGAAQTVAGGLFAPYGVALHGHNAYVTTGSVLPGGGQVVKVPLAH